MPSKKKRPARSGSKTVMPAKPRFDPAQGRLPAGIKPAKGGKGGKPMLFPGRTGGR